MFLAHREWFWEAERCSPRVTLYFFVFMPNGSQKNFVCYRVMDELQLPKVKLGFNELIGEKNFEHDQHVVTKITANFVVHR